MAVILLLLAAFAAGCGTSPATAFPTAVPPPSTIDPERLRAELATTPSTLDSNVVPLHHLLELRVDPDAAGLSGRILTTIDVARATDSVRIHACERVEIRAVRIESEVGPLTWERASVTPACETLLTGPTIAAGRHTLAIEFAAPWGIDGAIFRFERDGLRYVASHMAETLVRRSIPLFDEPAYKVPFEVVIDAPDELVVATNAPLAERPSSTPSGLMRHRFHATPPMPAYLLAVAVGPWDVLEVPPDPELAPVGGAAARVRIRMLTVRGTEGWRPIAARIRPYLTELERYTGISYPYRKLDIAVVPIIDTIAMENPGLVYFVDWSLQIGPRASSDRRRFAEWVMAHELAHMWFGNLVTMHWWNELWLNEAFATWLASRAVEDIAPAHQQYVADASDRAAMLAEDAAGLAPPIVGDVDGTPASVAASVTLQPYYKGAPMLRGFERFVGEEHFRDAIRQYLRVRSWQTADRADLAEAFGAAMGAEERQRLHRWLDSGLEVGAPRVHVDWQCDATAVQVDATVDTFAWRGTATPETSTPWSLPVCVAFGDDEWRDVRCLAVEDAVGNATFEVDACPTWLHPQAHEDAYYVWSMETDDLRRVTSHLDRLSAAERVSLPDQLTWAWSSGALTTTTWIAVVSELAEAPALGAAGRARLAARLLDYRVTLGAETASELARRLVDGAHPLERSRALLDLRVHVLEQTSSAADDTELYESQIEHWRELAPGTLDAATKRMLAAASAEQVSAFLDSWEPCSPWTAWNLGAVREEAALTFVVEALIACSSVPDAWHETVRWNPAGAAAILRMLETTSDQVASTGLPLGRARVELEAGARAALCESPGDVAALLATHPDAALPDETLVWNAHCHALQAASRD